MLDLRNHSLIVYCSNSQPTVILANASFSSKFAIEAVCDYDSLLAASRTFDPDVIIVVGSASEVPVKLRNQGAFDHIPILRFSTVEDAVEVITMHTNQKFGSEFIGR